MWCNFRDLWLTSSERDISCFTTCTSSTSITASTKKSRDTTLIIKTCNRPKSTKWPLSLRTRFRNFKNFTKRTIERQLLHSLGHLWCMMISFHRKTETFGLICAKKTSEDLRNCSHKISEKGTLSMIPAKMNLMQTTCPKRLNLTLRLPNKMAS